MCVFGKGRQLSKTWSSKFCWFDAKLDTSTLPVNLKTEQNQTKKINQPKHTTKQPPTSACVLPKCQVFWALKT